MHDIIAGKATVSMDPFSPEQQYEIQLIAESFLKGQKEEIEELNSMRWIKELFN